MLDINAQLHFAAGHSGEFISDHAKVRADQREKVAGLWMRVAPFGKMPSIRQPAGRGHVAVRKQHRRVRRFCFDPHGIDRKDIWAVVEISHPAEALGLALGAVNILRQIQPGQRLVRGRRDFGFNLKREFAVRQISDGQRICC